MPNTTRLPPAEDTPTPRFDILDWFQHVQTHFGRYGLDIAGVGLLALAAITMLGLMGLTEGQLVDPWALSLRRWLGWGSWFIVIGMGLAGLALLRKRQFPNDKVRWGRVLALEMAAIFTLPLLSILSDDSVQLAGAGEYGGYIGWALSYILGRLLADGRLVFVLLGFFFFGFVGLGFVPRLENLLWKLSGEMPPQDFQAIPGEEPAPVTDEPAIPLKAAASAPKKQPPLPPEFRKNFKVPEKQDEKPTAPQPRSESLPPLTLLFGDQSTRPDERHINQTAGLIEKTLSEFGIPAKVIGFRIGPTITQFAVQPGFIKKPGLTAEDEAQMLKVRVAQIAALQKDLTLALSAQRLRIEAPVPGKSFVGIEVPNERSTTVRMRAILESEQFQKSGAPLAIALGRDVSGNPVVADLARMPHLLIAGATGSGKSVCVTALAACLALNNSPAELRIVMVDAKMVELIRFNGLPHLYGKVETDVNRIMGVLRWVVVEMEHRYRLLESSHARDLETYNRKLVARKETPLPRIVVIVDELADLMMSAPDQTEHNLVRLAQMARATGIHLVVATQRPSTDVVTGLIKANFPARLAFSVASGVDSRVILDTPGAETLLGRGDMLFLNPEVGNPIRAQGVYVTDQEIERVIAFWQKLIPASNQNPPWESLLQEPEEGEDSLVQQAVEIVRQSQRASASLLQRKLRIGYPRAARLLDELEEMGVVGPSQGGGKERGVLVEREDGDDEMDDE